ncbi:hypothetical protein ACO0SA_001294 [Hanseniaspora valbyensis]
MSLKRKLSDPIKEHTTSSNVDLVEEISYQTTKKSKMANLQYLGDLPTQKMSLSNSNKKNAELKKEVPKEEENTVIATILSDSESNKISFEVTTKLFKNNDSLIKIGRSSSCNIQLNDLLISSVHLEIKFDSESKKLQVKCIGRNGTTINGIKIRNTNFISLYNNDVLVLGEKIKLKIQYKRETKSIYDYYKFGNELGVGHYAVVKTGINKITGKKFAIKEFHKQNIKDLYKFEKESEILINLKHENIIKLFDTFIEPIPNEHDFFKTFLVMDYANGGELFNRIVKKGKLRIDESKDIFRQLLSGVKYLHLNHIIHRDIKPENVLLDIKYRDSNNINNENDIQTGPWDKNELSITVKLADFGLAKFIGGTDKNSKKNFTSTMCGSPGYVSPEILQNKEYCEKTDMWSLGVLLYILLCGFPPFSDQLGPPSMKQQIIEAKYAFYSPYWDEIPDIALDLISNLLQLDTKKRFSVIQAVNHPWFNDIIPHSQYHKFINRITPSQQQDTYLSQQKVKLIR